MAPTNFYLIFRNYFSYIKKITMIHVILFKYFLINYHFYLLLINLGFLICVIDFFFEYLCSFFSID
jgi:hypothetical protein